MLFLLTIMTAAVCATNPQSLFLREHTNTMPTHPMSELEVKRKLHLSPMDWIIHHQNKGDKSPSFKYQLHFLTSALHIGLIHERYPDALTTLHKYIPAFVNQDHIYIKLVLATHISAYLLAEEKISKISLSNQNAETFFDNMLYMLRQVYYREGLDVPSELLPFITINTDIQITALESCLLCLKPGYKAQVPRVTGHNSSLFCQFGKTLCLDSILSNASPPLSTFKIMLERLLHQQSTIKLSQAQTCSNDKEWVVNILHQALTHATAPYLGKCASSNYCDDIASNILSFFLFHIHWEKALHLSTGVGIPHVHPHLENLSEAVEYAMLMHIFIAGKQTGVFSTTFEEQFPFLITNSKCLHTYWMDACAEFKMSIQRYHITLPDTLFSFHDNRGTQNALCLYFTDPYPSVKLPPVSKKLQGVADQMLALQQAVVDAWDIERIQEIFPNLGVSVGPSSSLLNFLKLCADRLDFLKETPPPHFVYAVSAISYCANMLLLCKENSPPSFPVFQIQCKNDLVTFRNIPAYAFLLQHLQLPIDFPERITDISHAYRQAMKLIPTSRLPQELYIDKIISQDLSTDLEVKTLISNVQNILKVMPNIDLLRPASTSETVKSSLFQEEGRPMQQRHFVKRSKEEKLNSLITKKTRVISSPPPQEEEPATSFDRSVPTKLRETQLAREYAALCAAQHKHIRTHRLHLPPLESDIRTQVAPDHTACPKEDLANQDYFIKDPATLLSQSNLHLFSLKSPCL